MVYKLWRVWFLNINLVGIAIMTDKQHAAQLAIALRELLDLLVRDIKGELNLDDPNLVYNAKDTLAAWDNHHTETL